MRSAPLVLALALVLPPAEAADKPREVTFSKADADRLPAGWTATKTGEGKGSVWKVTRDDTAPSKTGYVLTQTAESPSRLFNLCLLDDTRFTDGEVSVMVRAVDGMIDEGGGVLWRGRDANNYYTCRYNPLEENFRLYKVVDGKRIQLATKEDVALPAGKWFNVTVRQKGNQIECLLDGKKHLTAKDDSLPSAGKVGLWTKADAVTSFDQLKIAPIER